MHVSFEEFQRTILSREDVEVLDSDLLNTECRRGHKFDGPGSGLALNEKQTI